MRFLKKHTPSLGTSLLFKTLATYSIACALLTSPAAAAPAIPSDSKQTKPTSQDLSSSRSSISTRNVYEPRHIVLEGELAEGIDHTWNIVQAFPLESRQKVAAIHKVSLAKVPTAHIRRVSRAPNGPSEDEIRKLLQRRVRAVTIRDRSGHFFLLSLEAI